MSRSYNKRGPSRKPKVSIIICVFFLIPHFHFLFFFCVGCLTILPSHNLFCFLEFVGCLTILPSRHLASGVVRSLGYRHHSLGSLNCLLPQSVDDLTIYFFSFSHLPVCVGVGSNHPTSHKFWCGCCEVSAGAALSHPRSPHLYWDRLTVLGMAIECALLSL